jgi:hexosaminidase
VGWEEIAKVPLPPDAIVQHWHNEELARAAVRQGARVIMSPATRAYLDMKLDATTKLGLEWAGYVSVRAASNWDPATQVAEVTEADVIGVEACLWSETLETYEDIEYMAFPRLVGIAGVARGALTRRPA